MIFIQSDLIWYKEKAQMRQRISTLLMICITVIILVLSVIFALLQSS